MISIEIYLKTALDLHAGPTVEHFKCEDLAELKNLFRYFPQIKFENNKIYKQGVPVGRYYEANNSD